MEQDMERHHIASVSWGKDSLAMLHMLIDKSIPLDEVVFYDTGAEFEAIYAERDRTLPLLAEHGVKYTELRPRRPFFFDMLAKTVRKRDGSMPACTSVSQPTRRGASSVNAPHGSSSRSWIGA